MMYPYLIQTQGEQLDRAISSITKSSLELAEASANYGALKVIFGVFLVFVIILVIFFVFLMINTSRKIDTIHEASTKVQAFFEGVSEHTLGLSSSQVMVRRMMNDLSSSIKYIILRIRLENHISDQEITHTKIERICKNQFSDLSQFLSNYTYDGRTLSSVIDMGDLPTMIEFVTEQVYIPKEEFSISSMDQSVDIFINGLKLVYLKKL